MVTFNFKDIGRGIRNLKEFERQIPFALAKALNASAEIGRRELIETTWPGHVEARDNRFLSNALTTKGQRATKTRLRVVVYDQLGRAHLTMQETGGSKKPRGRNIAIPGRVLANRRSTKGIPKGSRPTALQDTFVTDGQRPNTHLQQNAIYQRTGQYHKKGSIISRTGKRRVNKDGKAYAADSRKVTLMYFLRPSTKYKARVPFHQDFDRTVKREIQRQFSIAMKAAMQTAFRR